jgi:non-homologous end joining protein Ku
VSSHHKARGYEVGDEQFVIIEDTEIEQAREEARTRPYSQTPAAATDVEPSSAKREPLSEEPKRGVEQAEIVTPPRPRVENTRTIEIERFVPREQIDPRYHHTPYYITPRDVIGQEAFAVIRDAMAGKEVVAMGHVVLSNRERPIILEPMGLGLRGMTLRYVHEIRSEAEFFSEIPQLVLPEQMLSVAEHIVDTKRADFDPAYLEDRYRTTLVSILREKKAKVPAHAAPAVPSRKNIVDLMDVLKRSLQTERPSRGTTGPKPAQRRAVATTSKRAPTKSSKMPGRSSRSR